MTTEEARMIVKVAHGRGKKVTAHVQEAYLVEKALDAGIDDICHSQVDEPVPDHLIERMVEQGMSIVPTLEMSNTWQPALVTSLDNLRRMVELGVNVAIGTDYSYTFDIEFEIGMPLLEMRLMERAGMTPMQIIVAGTKNSAHVAVWDESSAPSRRARSPTSSWSTAILSRIFGAEARPHDGGSLWRDHP